MIFRTMAMIIALMAQWYSASMTAAHSETPPGPQIKISKDVNGCQQIRCSYCGYTCLFPPDIIDDEEKQSLNNHVCKMDFSQCNVFICKKYLLVWGSNCEMCFERDGSLVCYKCKKNFRKEHAASLCGEILEAVQLVLN